MKKTLSKIKNKSSKGSEQKNGDEEGVNVQSNALGARGTNTHIDDKPLSQKKDKLNIYNANVDSTKKIRGKPRNDLLPEKSTTTYEAFTSSTSESDRDRKANSGRRFPREIATKNGKKYRDADPEVCITVPEEGKGNIRIVGNVSASNQLPPAKQVDFASLDAVYGTTSEESSDEEADDMHFNKNHTEVYRAEGESNNFFSKGSMDRGPSGRRDNEGDQSSPEQENAQENFRPRRNQGVESENIDKISRVQPTLTVPLISVNIQTSQEELSHELSKDKINTDTQKTSSRLIRLKQHLFENGVGGNLKTKQNDTPELDALGNMEKDNGHIGAGKTGNISKNEMYYAEETGKDAADLRDALEKLIMISKHDSGSHNNHPSHTGANTQSRLKLENIESKNKFDEIVRSVNSGLTRPLIYVATVDNNALLAVERGFNNKDMDQNKENILKIASESSPKNVSLNKRLSKQSSKKKTEIIGSKIGLKKSKKSFLKSSIPKPSSVCSRRKSSMSVGKINRSVEGSSSRTSKKYVIRDIMVIPEEQVGQQFADVYPAQPLNHDIPEETVMFAEREIRLHDLNNGPIYETDNQFLKSSTKQADSPNMQQNTLKRNSPMNLKNNIERESIPCLYYCSTSTVNTGGGTKNNFVYNAVVECSNNQKNLASDPPFASNRQRGGEIIDNNNVLSNHDSKLNTIVIDSETHREIMEAIDASNGKERIISLSTKVSRKDSAGKRQSLGVKRSKGVNSLRRQESFVETIMEEDTQDEVKENLQNRNSKLIQSVPTNVTNATGNIETDRSELFEIRKKVDFRTPKQSEHNEIHPFTGENHRENATCFLAYPSHVNNHTPLNYNQDTDFENDQISSNTTKRRKKGIDKSKYLRPDRRKESKVIGTILSFSEPYIKEGSNNSLNIYENTPLNSSGKQTAGRQSKRKAKTPKYITQTPETMVYVGKLPNTTYNVFFSPEHTSHPQEDDVRNVQSDTKKLSPIKSEKLLEQGPKAILIFVNKKTELNRNPFDGNVMYDDDNQSKGKKGKDREKKGKRKHGKGKNKTDRARSTKSGKSARGSDFDVASIHDPGSRSGDGVIIEKSPSGLKTVIKYPCGCMKITRIDPENETVTEEITSAFCRLGSKCEISQSQKDKRLLKYAADGSRSKRESTSYRELPSSPQLDIVIEGLLSKKPIQPQPPAQQMKGANLTGTLTIKTNRCNGVFNFYIDPRLKQYLRNNLACITNKKDNSYSRSYTS